MNLCITMVCSVVAVAAAVRSTWSPCGLSMLSTITPVSERAKGHSYRSTAAWFVAGATIGGASLGLLMAASALAVGGFHLSVSATGAMALAASLVATASDTGVAGFHLPSHRRQVNERWLDQFRPWVYGAGFGWQIGSGLATYITTAAVYLMIVLGALTGRPLVAFSVGAGFGLLRGTAVLLTRHVTDPVGLRAFHRRFFEVGPLVGQVVAGVELGAAVFIAGWLGSPVAIALAAAGAVTLVAVTVGRSRRSGRPHESPACPVSTGIGRRDDALASVEGAGLEG